MQISILRIIKAIKKAELELQNIINNCNDICNELQTKGYDISKLDMNLTKEVRGC